MRQKGFLITGTDTGVGKTFIGCGLLSAFRRRGLHVAPFKPAETGCEIDRTSGELIPADAALLLRASETPLSLEAICPYRFRMPVAPWVAAQREAKPIDPALLAERYKEIATAHDVVIVETAGGILVPLTEQFHYGNLARLLELPVLVVAGSKLGVINHALLTLEYLNHAGLRVLGCVLNHAYAERNAATETNAGTLAHLAGTRVFVIPRLSASAHNETDGLFDELSPLQDGGVMRTLRRAGGIE
jgi:dethiobiotin synthetase